MDIKFIYFAFILFFAILIYNLFKLGKQNKAIIKAVSVQKALLFPAIILLILATDIIVGYISFPLYIIQALVLISFACITEGVKGRGIVAQDKTLIKWDKITHYQMLTKETHLKVTFYTKYLNKRYSKFSMNFMLDEKENLIKVLDSNIKQ